MIPENIAQREQYFLNKIKSGVNLVWNYIISEDKGNVGQFWIMDPIMIDGIIITNSAYLQQQIADFLDCSFLTVKMVDLVFDQADVRLKPHFQPISSSVDAMKKHSKNVLSELNNREGLASPMGKYWCLSNDLVSKPGMALNYGWHFTGGKTYQKIKGYPCDTGLKDPKTGIVYHTIQPSASSHDFKHTDYSQVCILTHNDCFVNGEWRRLEDILTSPSLSGLVSHEGPLKITRQPGVPKS